MNDIQAIAVLVGLAETALGAGLIKNFQHAADVTNAVGILTQKVQAVQQAQVAKPASTEPVKAEAVVKNLQESVKPQGSNRTAPKTTRKQ